METKLLAKKRNGWPSLFENNTRLFDVFFQIPIAEFLGRELTTPAVNITETDSAYGLSVAAPGMVKEDFKVEVSEGMLTISTEKETNEKEEKENYNRREYNYSSWMRSFNLPKDVDTNKIEEECKNGELKIRLPKSELAKVNNAKTITID